MHVDLPSSVTLSDDHDEDRVLATGRGGSRAPPWKRLVSRLALDSIVLYHQAICILSFPHDRIASILRLAHLAPSPDEPIGFILAVKPEMSH